MFNAISTQKSPPLKRPVFETKDAGGSADDLSAETKELLEGIKKSWADFKERQDQVDAEIKKVKSDVITQEAVDRVNEDLSKKLDDLQTHLKKEQDEREALESKFNKAGAGVSGGGDNLERKLLEMGRIGQVYHKSREIPAVTADDYLSYKSGIEKMLRGYSDYTEAERKAMTVGSDPAGGFFVTPDTSGGIVRYIQESSAMRAVANVRQLGTDALEGKYQLGDAAAAWAGETQARAETATPTYGKWNIPAHEIYAWPEISLKMLEDPGLDAEAELASVVRDVFMRKEETAFFTGSGVGQPRGILTYTAGTPANTSVAAYEVIRQTGTGVSGGFAATNPGDIFQTVIGQTKQQFLARAAWMMNRTTLAATRKLKDGDGTYLLEKSFQANQPFVLLGYPIRMAEDMPAIGANSLSVAFGDFNAGYTILDRLGISTLIDPYTSTTGFVKYKSRRRVGGGVTQFEALQLIKFG